MRKKIIGILFLAFGSTVNAGQDVGKLGFVTGEVFVDGKPGRNAQPLVEGNWVETKNGKCALLLGNENVFYLAPNSKMRIQQFGQTIAEGKSESGQKALLDLQNGKTRALIKSKTGSSATKNIQIKAQGVVMGVRGTEFTVDSDSVGVQCVVQNGSVDLVGLKSGAEKISLGTNDAFESKGGDRVQKLSGKEAQKVADAVVGKQFAAATASQLNEVKNAKGIPPNGPKGPGMMGGPKGGMFGFKPFFGPGMGPGPLDPGAIGAGGNMNITVQVQ